MSRRMIKDFSQPAPEEEIPEIRPRKMRRHWPRVLAVLVIVSAVIMALCLLIANWDRIASVSFLSWIDNLMSASAQGSWPVSVDGEDVRAISPIGNNAVVLTDTASIYYNESGGETLRRTHAFSKPILDTAGRYVLIAEQGGNRYRLETRFDIISELTSVNTIYNVAVSEKGDIALITDSSQSHVSEVTVFSKKGEQHYQWLSSEWLVMDVCFSSDGNRLAAVSCRSTNGAMESAIMIFDLHGDQEQPVTYIDREMLYAKVNVFNNGMVTAIGDRSVRVVNPSGSLDQTISYNGEELIGFALNNGVAVVTRSRGSQDGGRLIMLSTSGDIRLDQTFEGEFRDISSFNSGYLVLTEREIAEWNEKGVKRSAAVESDALMTQAVGNTALVLGLTQLSAVAWEEGK